ncbi:MAG: hypothetical protein GXO85_10900 [Chlorobi bacterium]|nr:hypothetical protein [Chlorobiota bacterium]
MQTIQGQILNLKQPNEVISYLKQLERKVITADPKRLKIFIDQEQAYLLMDEGLKPVYPIRKVFLIKLLKWFNISYDSISHLSDEIITAICNENLSNINHKEINVTIENGEALTLNSPNYTRISDLDIIEIADKIGISKISRDDYFLRIFTKKKLEVAPLVNDVCGFGFNIVNSETGFSPVKLEHFILRYWCTNGATAPISIQNEVYFHYKSSKENILKLAIGSLNNADSSRQLFIRKLKESADQESIKYFPDIIFRVNSILSQSYNNSFFNGFDKRSSKYNLFNHITDKAKKFDLLKRYKLEQLAGNIILN